LYGSWNFAELNFTNGFPFCLNAFQFLKVRPKSTIEQRIGNFINPLPLQQSLISDAGVVLQAYDVDKSYQCLLEASSTSSDFLSEIAGRYVSNGFVFPEASLRFLATRRFLYLGLRSSSCLIVGLLD
jgi:hypothetical protein